MSVQRGIEANAGGQGAAAVAGSAEEVRLGAFAQTRLGELLDGILLAVLVDGEVDGEGDVDLSLEAAAGDTPESEDGVEASTDEAPTDPDATIGDSMSDDGDSENGDD